MLLFFTAVLRFVEQNDFLFKHQLLLPVSHVEQKDQSHDKALIKEAEKISRLSGPT